MKNYIETIESLKKQLRETEGALHSSIQTNQAMGKKLNKLNNMPDNQESPSKELVKYPAIKCSKYENNVPSFWSDIIGYEMEMAGNKDCALQLCTNCQPPLTNSDIASVMKYLKERL